MSISDRGTIDALKIDRRDRPAGRGAPWGILILVFVVFAVLAGGWMFWKKSRGPEVRTMVVRAGTNASTGNASAFSTGNQTLLNASGYVTARRAATVSAKVTGKVMAVLVEEGMTVEAGQIVARLDDSNALAGLRLAEARIEAARLVAAETRPSLAFAQLELERFVKLRASNAASQSDIARAETEVETLQARQLRQAADVVVAERQVDEWKQQVDDTIIRAPFAGVVTTKDAQPGEIISPMSSGGFTRTGICTVVDMSSLEIEVDVNESYLNRVSPGQPAEATLDAYGDWRIPCKIIAIIPTADRQKATVKVRVGFVNPDPRILPEMGVKVAFLSAPEPTPPARAAGDSASSPNAPAETAPPPLLIPAAALSEENGRTVVWVFRDNKAERRAVRVSRTSGTEATLASGLSAGEKVILDPPSTLVDGTTVRESNP